MRRVYYTKKKSKVQEQALKQLRETREKIKREHPGLLSTIREHIENASRSPEPAQEVEIDRVKNLTTIMKFVEMKQSGSDSFETRLRELLLENKSRLN